MQKIICGGLDGLNQPFSDSLTIHALIPGFLSIF